jgi:hypothetical protein
MKKMNTPAPKQLRLDATAVRPLSSPQLLVVIGAAVKTWGTIVGDWTKPPG